MTQSMTQGATQTMTPSAPSVIRLPQQGRDDLLLIAYRGVVREEDYRKNFYEPVLDLVKTKKRFRLMVHYTAEFKGWEKGAADLSFRSIYENGKFAEKVAMVNPPEKRVLQTKLTGDLFGGESRHFAESELDRAMAWLKE